MVSNTLTYSFSKKLRPSSRSAENGVLKNLESAERFKKDVFSRDELREFNKRSEHFLVLKPEEISPFSLADPGEGPGGPAPPNTPTYFETKLRPEGPKKIF